MQGPRVQCHLNNSQFCAWHQSEEASLSIDSVGGAGGRPIDIHVHEYAGVNCLARLFIEAAPFQNKLSGADSSGISLMLWGATIKRDKPLTWNVRASPPLP